MPLFPWHRLVTCSHLLLSCGASFACLFVVLSPSGTPVLVVFGRAFLALFVCCLLLVSLFAVASLCRFWSVGFSACVFAVVFSLAFVCCLLCCGAASPPFCLVCLLLVLLCCAVAPPRWLLPPSPHRLFPCGVLVQFLCWSLPLGIWLLHATARLPCLNAWGVVVLCFLASFCFMAAKAFGPVWGFVLPSTPWCICCCGALCSCTEVFIFG